MDTSFTPAEVELAFKTFHKLLEYPSSVITTIFYNQIFLKKPELRALFKEDLTSQKHAFWGMLQSLVLVSHNPDTMRFLSQLLGERHKEFQIQHIDHTITHDALLQTFSTILQEEWGEQEKAVWSKLYTVIASGMMERGTGQQENELLHNNAKLQQLYMLFIKQTAELTRVSDELFFVRQQLQATESKNSEIIEMIIHNIKNPVVGIQRISESLDSLLHRRGDPLDYDRMTQSVVMIHKTTENILNLITKIRNIQQLEQKKTTLFIAPINLSLMLQHLLHDIQHLQVDKTVHFCTHVGENLIAHADPLAANEIFTQLLKNAVHHSPDNSRVCVTATSISNNTTIRCSIKDEGPGIPHDVLKDMFTPTDRRFLEDNHPSSQRLGLLTVKTLTDALHGRVWCETTPGKGSEFFVEFPVYDTSQ